LTHDLVEPDVGDLQGLVEDIEAGGTLMSSLPNDCTAALLEERTVPCAVPTRPDAFLVVAAEMFRRGAQSAKVPASMPRPTAGNPNAVSDWNFISSIGALVRSMS